MRIQLSKEERIYLFNILQRLAFKSGEVNGRKARRKVQAIAERLDPARVTDPDLSRVQLNALLILLNGYAVVATSSKNNPNTEEDKQEFLDKSLDIIRAAQEKVQRKLESINEDTKANESKH